MEIVFLRIFFRAVFVSFWLYPDPDPYHLKRIRIRIRIRPNDTDPTGSGSGSGSGSATLLKLYIYGKFWFFYCMVCIIFGATRIQINVFWDETDPYGSGSETLLLPLQTSCKLTGSLALHYSTGSLQVATPCKTGWKLRGIHQFYVGHVKVAKLHSSVIYRKLAKFYITELKDPYVSSVATVHFVGKRNKNCFCFPIFFFTWFPLLIWKLSFKS